MIALAVVAGKKKEVTQWRKSLTVVSMCKSQRFRIHIKYRSTMIHFIIQSLDALVFAQISRIKIADVV